MGELAISSGEELEVKAESENTGEGKLGKQSKEETECETGEVGKKKKKKISDGNGLSNGLVRWERLLPRMVLRVLLVEADDSTRQIIAALLRKCSYRVASVPDGLKAWEILKGRPHNIDLILTEVDLPSISGYALLTLIMEHEICKNIPVIMMSSQDSINTVYKCMLRGAADYLVKPIRKNELRNLWQHVWRRQSSLGGGNGLQDESVGQDKLEATSENNAASNHSSVEMARFQRNKGQAEKGSDAQSSCTKPDLEAESAPGENMQDVLQPAWIKFSSNDIKMQMHEPHLSSHEKLLTHEGEAGGLAMAAIKDVNRMSLNKNVEPKNQRVDPNVAYEACDNNYVLVNSHREAIDFMGASANHNPCSTSANRSFDSSPHLDLSLRRSHPSGFEIKVTEERHTLRHSDASAFTRYTNRPLHPPQSTLVNIVSQRELEANSDRKISNNVNGYNSNGLGPPPCIQKSILSMAVGQTKESEIATSSSGQKVYPIQIPVKGIRFDDPGTGFGSIFPPIFCKQSGTSPMVSPSSASQPELAFKMNPFHLSNSESTSEQPDRIGQNANDCTNGTLQKQDHKLDSVEDRGHVPPAADQSTSSSFCNGAVSHLNSMGYGSTSGSNSNIDQVTTVRVAAESKNEEGVFTQNSNPHRSIQREAALTKFRLKRKERCYEKKVRYESRKKLAEQRPRVKGQFVRQLQNDPAPIETD